MGWRRRITVSTDAEMADSEVLLTVDGERRFTVEAALGSPQRPMTPEALAAKRRSLAGERLEGALDDPQRPAVELLETLGI